MADQFKKVRSLNWVAPSQHENWNLQRRDLFDQLFALIRTEFHGTPGRLGGSAAMYAGEVACLGHFPDGDEWPFVEVDRVDLRVHELIRQPHSGWAQ